MLWELRVALAVVKKNSRVLRRYPVNLANLVLLPLYQLLLPSLFLGWTFLVGFLFLGALMSSFTFAAFWGTSFGLTNEMQTGALEANWLTPARPESLVLGSALASFIIAGVAGAVLTGIGALVFGAHYLVTTLLALPALALALIGLVGIVYMVTSTILVLRESNFMIDGLNYLFMVTTGVMFPVTVLPLALRWISYLLPPTYSLDLLRANALGGTTLMPVVVEYALLAAAAVLFLGLGRWLFVRTERRMRNSGSLAFH